ncbi:MAG: hypothetical protein M3239_03370 [Thermoproteota archaeon]|nr:hypothetical protein [Thermoproteota archaeon]
MAVTSSSAAERVAENILSSNDEILSISVIDRKGNIIASISKEYFERTFGEGQELDKKYGGTLAIAALSVANELKELVGEAKALITIYRDCKMMLLPIPSYEIMVGFVLPSSSNAEDYEITNKIEGWFRANNNTATIKPQ